MITKATYEKLMQKIRVFDAWVDTKRNKRNGWASYSPSEIPKNLPRVSNAQRSAVQAYAFKHNPPQKYLVYVRRHVCAPGTVDNHVEVTTWTGQLLGKGYLGVPYKTGRPPFQSRRYPIRFKGINGKRYRGTYYASAGDYARVQMVKE